MEMIPVRSTNLSDVGHDGRHLYVKFLSGQTYRCIGVPDEVFKELLRVPSKGVYLARNVKGKYPYQNVT